MHIPVLLNKVIESLNLQTGGKYIDATINGGGHGLAILEKIQPDGKLLGIEWDRAIYNNLKNSLSDHQFLNNIRLVNDNYVNLHKIAQENGFMGADGVLFDFGMSTWHLESERGFSFLKDEPLDMRYNPEDEFQISNTETAADIVNQYIEEDLADLIYNYGQERCSRSIAREIVKARKEEPITRTFQLVEAIKRGMPFRARVGRLHFATKTFQALRIAVNHELENVEEGLQGAFHTVKNGGRVAAISFHSLEDRIVKNYFKILEKEGLVKFVNKKPIVADFAEIKQNPRSRSAKLRVVEKI
jgi:16S rRNA (cytosine1402-N4)-methyltransferase